MRQLMISSYGDPDVLVLDDVPIPVVSADGAVVKVTAAPLQIADVALREGRLADVMPDPSTPMPIGWEFAGTITDVGADVIGFAQGDDVIGMSRHFFTRVGTQAEYVAVPATGIAHAPQAVDAVAASTIPIALTAQQALDVLAVDDTTRLLVTGAVGTVGGYALQLAAARGASVIASIDQTDAPLAKQLGANHVVDRRGDVAHQVHTVVPGGVDALFNAGNDPTAIAAVRDHGRMVGVLLPTPEPERGVETAVIFVEPDPGQLAALAALADDDALHLRVAATYRLQDAAAAHHRLAAGGLRGRLVFDLRAEGVRR